MELIYLHMSSIELRTNYNFQDRHTTENHTAPILDASQDWLLLHGEENDQGTILKFIRKLDTCDSPDDIPVNVNDKVYFVRI